MLKVFLASHGRMASGMLESLKILIGNFGNVTGFDAFVDERSLPEVLAEYFTEVSPTDTVVMCSDLYGGSVNQMMFRFLTRENTFLVAGINLPLLLELAIKESLTKEELLFLVGESRAALRFVEFEEVISAPAEDFF